MSLDTQIYPIPLEKFPENIDEDIDGNTFCERSVSCVQCHHLRDCFNCKYSIFLIECDNSDLSKYCTHSNGIIECNYSFYLEYCTYSDNCEKCIDCHYCKFCEKCSHSTNLYDCYECDNSHNLYKSRNINHYNSEICIIELTRLLSKDKLIYYLNLIDNKDIKYYNIHTNDEPSYMRKIILNKIKLTNQLNTYYFQFLLNFRLVCNQIIIDYNLPKSLFPNFE